MNTDNLMTKLTEETESMAQNMRKFADVVGGLFSHMEVSEFIFPLDGATSRVI